MPPRLTRKESQQQTRERLLDAALEVFSRRGYHAASVDEIAAEASLSKGAVYSNFSSKEDVFLALIDRRFASEVQTYPGIVSFIEGDEQPGKGLDFNQVAAQDRAWNLVIIEFFLYATRNEEICRQLADRMVGLREQMRKNLADLFAQQGKTPALPIEELPWSIFALGLGLGIMYYIDPESLPQGLYERALLHLLE